MTMPAGAARWIAVLFVLLLPAAVPAQNAAQRGWSVSQEIAALRRPLGVSVTSRLRYTLPLYRDRSGVLWDSTRVEIGLSNQLSPAFDDLAVEVMVEPVAVLDVAARAGVRYAYDGLGFGFAALPSYDADYDDPGDLSYRSAPGWFAAVTPRLKGQVGPVIVANALSVVYFDFSGTGASHFYEQVYDIALQTRDHLLQNTTLLLYDLPVQAPRVVRVGGTYLFQSVPGSGERTRRIAMVGIWEEPIGRSRRRLSVALVLGPYLEHRTYQATPADLFVAGQVGLAGRL